ncbi:MAG: hypothetical protein HYY16_10265 [Planctomycetes bacterium]|nr:hypothetical protein [Planctomycetota bacterium]
MTDRDLSVRELMRILKALGSTVAFSDTGYIKAWRTLPDGQLVAWQQHCHKGLKDIFRKHVVRDARRSLRFRETDGTSDHAFYSAK